MSELKIAGVQMDIVFGKPVENLKRIRAFAQQTVDNGAWLTVFPECSTTGYCFSSLAEALPFAELRDGPSFQEIHQICQTLDTHIIYGYLEIEGDQVYNALSLVGPTGILGSYRKVHLPMLGIDRFTTAGDSFEVIDLPQAKIGMCICYDSSFPESARSLALDGAELIVLPTNWPPTSGLTADVIPAARALENHVYFMAINRVGLERGFEFIGKSSICDPSGQKLASADHNKEAILYAQIDPEFARQKHLVNIPGEHEVHRINDRRPRCYRSLTAKNQS